MHISEIYCTFAENLRSMLLWLLIIGAIVWTIDLTWRTYRVTNNFGFAFIVFLFCIGATPLIAYFFVGKYLYN